jgi:hypothetical protein
MAEFYNQKRGSFMSIKNEILGVVEVGGKPVIVDNAAHLQTVDHKDFSKYTSKLADTPLFESKGGNYGFTNLSGKDSLLSTMEANAESNKDLRAMLSENIATLGTGRETRELQNTVKDFTRNAERNARDLARVAENAIKKSTAAINALTTDFTKLKTELVTEHSKNLSKFIKAEAEFSVPGRQNVEVKINDKVFTYNSVDELKAAKEVFEKNHSQAMSHYEDIYHSRLSAHNNTISEVNAVVSKVEEHTGVKIPLKSAEKISQEATALEKTAADAGKKLEAGAKGAGFGTGLAIVGASTALGGVVGHQFDKEGSQSMTFAGGAIGAIGGFLAKNKIANLLGMAAHAR